MAVRNLPEYDGEIRMSVLGNVLTVTRQLYPGYKPSIFAVVNE
jgi:hypothetical protein